MRPRLIYLIAVIALLEALLEPRDLIVAMLVTAVPIVAIGFWIRKIDPPTSKASAE